MNKLSLAIRKTILRNKATFVAFMVALLAGGFLASAWSVMLLWGALSIALGFQSIGFGTACLVTAALSLFNGFFQRRG